MTQDTRKDPRAKIVSLNVRYKSATVDEFIENHSHDVSKGGIFIKTGTPFPQGTLLKFEIRLAGDDAVIAGVGRVVWRREPGQSSAEAPAGMGIKFIKVDEKSRANIDRLVAEKEGAGRLFTSVPAAPSVPPPAERASPDVPFTPAAPSAPLGPITVPNVAGPLPAPRQPTLLGEGSEEMTVVVKVPERPSSRAPAPASQRPAPSSGPRSVPPGSIPPDEALDALEALDAALGIGIASPSGVAPMPEVARNEPPAVSEEAPPSSTATNERAAAAPEVAPPPRSPVPPRPPSSMAASPASAPAFAPAAPAGDGTLATPDTSGMPARGAGEPSPSWSPGPRLEVSRPPSTPLASTAPTHASSHEADSPPSTSPASLGERAPVPSRRPPSEQFESLATEKKAGGGLPLLGALGVVVAGAVLWAYTQGYFAGPNGAPSGATPVTIASESAAAASHEPPRGDAEPPASGATSASAAPSASAASSSTVGAGGSAVAAPSNVPSSAAPDVSAASRKPTAKPKASVDASGKPKASDVVPSAKPSDSAGAPKGVRPSASALAPSAAAPAGSDAPKPKPKQPKPDDNPY